MFLERRSPSCLQGRSEAATILLLIYDLESNNKTRRRPNYSSEELTVFALDVKLKMQNFSGY